MSLPGLEPEFGVFKISGVILEGGRGSRCYRVERDHVLALKFSGEAS